MPVGTCMLFICLVVGDSFLWNNTLLIMFQYILHPSVASSNIKLSLPCRVPPSCPRDSPVSSAPLIGNLSCLRYRSQPLVCCCGSRAMRISAPPVFHGWLLFIIRPHSLTSFSFCFIIPPKMTTLLCCLAYTVELT